MKRRRVKDPLKKVEVNPIPGVRFSLIKEKKVVRSSRIFERDYRLLEEMDKVHLQ